MRHWRTTELVAGITAAELAQLTGRSEDAARSAAARHGVTLAPKRRGWPASVKRRAFELRQRGESIPRVSAAIGVPMRTVQFWLYESKEQAA